MPELPDLQVFAKNLDEQFSGQKLLHLQVVKAAKLKDSEAALKKELEGNTLKNVYREGKELRFLFANDALLGMHLMLNGALIIFDKQNEPKNTIAALHFTNKGLALTDRQALATIALNPVEKKGVDALSKDLDAAYLSKKLQSKTKIKTLLMDQDIIRGIGNAYADEILWKAGISPFSVAKAIPAEKVKELARAIPQVLKDAEKHIDKNNPGIIAGEVRDFLVIHNSKLKESPTGNPIKVDKVNGRSTYYTDEQKMFE